MRSWPRRLLAALLLCGAGMGLALPSAAEPEALHKPSFLDLRQDLADATAASRMLMVMFEQDHCAYCAEMRRVNLAEAEARSLIRRHFDLVAVDILGDRELRDFSGRTMAEKDFARAQRVQLTPMTLFIGTDGKEVFRMAGYYRPPAFKAALRYVAERRFERESFRDYQQRLEAGPPAAPRNIGFGQGGDLGQALAKAAAGGRGLVLLFERDRCADCQDLEGGLLANPPVLGALLRDFDGLRLDMGSRRPLRNLQGKSVTAAELAAAMGIGYAPTLVFLDAQGMETFRLDSYRRPEHIGLVLRYLASGAHRRHASFQDWLRAERPAAAAAVTPGGA